MKRNALAWAALIVSTAALVSSRGVTRPCRPLRRSRPRARRRRDALSDAFNAVAEFVKPSVVQIRSSRKGAGTGRRGGNPFGPDGPNPNGPQNLTRKILRRCSSGSSGPVCDLRSEQFGRGRGRRRLGVRL